MDGEDTALRDFCIQARAAWPELDLDHAGFVAFVAARLAGRRLDALSGGDLYLVFGCTVEDPRALALLDERYIQTLGPALARIGAEYSTDDVLQLLRIQFLVGEPERPPRIASYDGSGRLATWLRVAAVRLAISVFRKERGAEREEERDLADAAPDPELALMQQAFSVEFRAAFQAGFAALEPRERILLRYHAIERLGIDRIAALHGVHRATAARWLGHAREHLLEHIRSELQTRIAATPEELDSILQRFRSTMDISLSMLLTPVAG